MNIEIRDYEPSDFTQVMNVWHETQLGGAQRGDTQDIIEQSIAMGGRLLVAVDNQKEIVGTSWMTFDGRRIHLHHIGVKPSHQRNGIGNLLTQFSLKHAKEMGYQIKLEVHKENIAAISIYKQLGFKYLGDYDVYIVRDVSSIPY